MSRAMKDSGKLWIGKMPSHWELKRIKNIIQQSKDGIKIGPFGSALTNKTIEDGEYNVYSQANLISADFSSTKHTIDRTMFVELKNYEVFPDDVCLSMMGTIGKCKIVPVGIRQGIMDSHLIKIRLSECVESRFFEFVYDKDLGGVCFAQMQYDKKGFIMDGLNTSIVKNLYFPLPPKDEQVLIADFLDIECSRIDAVIEQTRASIEEYKKLKQAVITQAVTKGIRPNRPLKYSGLAWVGEIPNDWRFTKTFNCLSMPITDGPHTTPELFDEGIVFISAEAVSCGNGRIDFSHKRGYISQSFYEECCKKYIPQIDDIYMIKSGATTGRVSMVDTLEPVFTIWSPLAVFRCDPEMTLPRFMYYALQSDGFQKQVEFGWTYGTQQNIGMRTLEQLKICVPSIDEQGEIVTYLDSKCFEIDRLIETKLEFLSKLDEYKKSLIFEYVTGKKEVRVC